jgi:hypothetical protein
MPSGRRLDGGGSILGERRRDSIVFWVPERLAPTPTEPAELRIDQRTVGFGDTGWRFRLQVQPQVPLEPQRGRRPVAELETFGEDEDLATDRRSAPESRRSVLPPALPAASADRATLDAADVHFPLRVRAMRPTDPLPAARFPHRPLPHELPQEARGRARRPREATGRGRRRRSDPVDPRSRDRRPRAGAHERRSRARPGAQTADASVPVAASRLALTGAHRAD